jgi:di/tricarboxylate transporter
MPVAIQIARKQGLPPGRVLMPLAFGSILGGMTTMIGTPPNLIVSGFRAEASGTGFAMFDFSPVGLLVAGCGVLFMALVGWRLVPARERAGVEGFDTGAYITEARVGKDSKAVGKSLREIGPLLEEADAQVIGMAREEYGVTMPNARHVIRQGDILVIECEPDTLANAISSLGLELEQAKNVKEKEKNAEDTETKKSASEEIALIELTVRPETALVGRSATDIQLRTRYGINLLAMSRKGKRSVRRLRSVKIKAGDVLLMQGPADAYLRICFAEYGCVPLAERAIRIPDKRMAIAATVVMAAAVGRRGLRLLPAAISFAAGVLVAMALRSCRCAAS